MFCNRVSEKKTILTPNLTSYNSLSVASQHFERYVNFLFCVFFAVLQNRIILVEPHPQRDAPALAQKLDVQRSGRWNI
jgi:hypothetical protein